MLQLTNTALYTIPATQKTLHYQGRHPIPPKKLVKG